MLMPRVNLNSWHNTPREEVWRMSRSTEKTVSYEYCGTYLHVTYVFRMFDLTGLALHKAMHNYGL